MSHIRVIGRNISFIALSRFVAVVVSFFLFPFIVSYVGKEIYGVYLIVMTITGYFGLLDLGVMSALTKYVSEYNGKGDEQTIKKIINASFTFYVLIGCIIALFLFACSLYFDLFFAVHSSNIEIVKQLFTVASIFALFVWPLNTFRGTVQGLNLWDVDATVNILTQILNALATLILLFYGYNIVELLIATQVLNVLAGICLWYISRKKVNLKINFPYIDVDTFKLIFNFSFFMFLSSLINIFLFQIHNILIGYFISMSAVTIYAVTHNIQNYFRYINSTIGAPPWTIASEMEGRCDYEGQKKLLFKGTKYASAVFLPIIMIMLFFADPFILYWMGHGFQESILPTRIIILFWLLNGTSEIAVGMLSAKGIVREPLYIQLAMALFNIVIGISLINVLGITAVALGLTLSMVFIGFPLFLRLSLRSLNIAFKEYFTKSIKCNIWLYLFVIISSFIALRYFYPVNIYFTLCEMAFVYFLSLVFYYFVTLDKVEKGEIIYLIGFDRVSYAHE